MKKIISILLLISMHAVLAKPAGTALFVVGKVVAKRGGAEVSLARGTGLETGDSIATGAGASAKIRYLNGTLVSIGSDSNYKILDFSPEQGDVVIKAELSKGKIESQTAGGKKREALKTPVVALAINGTTYKAYVPANGKTNVQLIVGQIKANGTNIKPGQSVVITIDGVKPAPFPVAGNVPASTVNSSNTAPTTSSSTSGTTTTESSTTGSTSTSESSGSTSSSESSSSGSTASTETETTVSIQTNDSTNTSYVSSASVASTSVSTSAAATAAVPPNIPVTASISIICLP